MQNTNEHLSAITKIYGWLTEYQKVKNMHCVISRKLENITDRKSCYSAEDNISTNDGRGDKYYKNSWCNEYSWSNDNNCNNNNNNSRNDNYALTEYSLNNDISPADYDYSGSCDNPRSNWYVLHSKQGQRDNTGFATVPAEQLIELLRSPSCLV